MGKVADAALRLRCVHCRNTETPLWRAGPDGPKTLCNACGVRYKKGKLALYRDASGNLTAVKTDDALPVVVPPPPKKPVKKPVVAPSSPTLVSEGAKRVVRKVSSEGAIAAAVAKKPRSRTRRANAGQLPGRYSNKALPDDISEWRSPAGSPHSSPSSPVESPSYDARFGLLSSPTSFNMEEPSLYQFSDPEQENMFPDVACLGIECNGGSDNLTLLPMPADPSSTEQFSFAFAELGRDASLAIDLPDRVDALRGLVQDTTRKVSRLYETTVLSLSRFLCQQRKDLTKPGDSFSHSAVEDRKDFVRRFATEHGSGYGMRSVCSPGELPCSASFGNDSGSRLMLSERAVYSGAVESFRSLMDSAELDGFAETCMFELLAEDVVSMLASPGFCSAELTSCSSLHSSSSLGSKALSAPA